MINQFKLGIKLLKYGFNLKTNIITGIIILLVGILVEVVSKGTNIIGGFYILLISMYSQQLIESVDLSTLVQTSKMKKALQTTVPAITSFVFYMIMSTVLVGVKALLIHVYPEKEQDIIFSLFSIALIAFLVMIYSGFVYKYFVLGMVMLFLFVVPISSMSTVMTMSGEAWELSFGATVGILYAAVIVGSALCYGLACLTYKKELSQKAFKSILQKMN